jgi:decaprenylphospho-beta-D-ribofuranose 2-oxidase
MDRERSLQRGEPVVLTSLTGQLPARTRLTPCSDEVLARPGALAGGFIPRGAGRSYGDASYLGGGHTLDARGLEGVLELDEQRGEIACRAGTPMRELARRALARGWMLPVGGGTGWVTAGGAVATDIHGKNDPVAGSLGGCVLELELITAAGERVRCGPGAEPELFAATVGGLGLTGLIHTVRLRLEPAGSGALRWRGAAVGSMAELLERMDTCAAPYQAGWLDLTGPTIRGIHHQAAPVDAPAPPPGWSLPAELPTLPLLSQRAIRLLNAALFRVQRGMDRVVDVRDFVWSVDQIPNWHSLFGRRGFHELQFSVPPEAGLEALEAVEREGRAAGVLPWFAMVKRFGDHPRAGLLSFPSPGITFTADYPMGPRTEPFLRRFSDRVTALGGRFCLAKDLVLAPEQVAAMYPGIEAWREVVRRWDPQHRVRSGLSDRLRLKPW